MSEVNNKANARWYDANCAIYELFAQSLETIISRRVKEEKLIIHSLTHRVKDRDSFLEKCIRKNYSNPESQMMDLAGLRIIAYTIKDVETACRIIEEVFDIDEENSQNKALCLGTDKVGYLSHHYIVTLGKERASLPEYAGLCNLKAEIQIRTLLQHAWAEIEHDREYKFSGQLPTSISRRFHLAAANLESVDIEFQRLSDEIDLYKEQIKLDIKEGHLQGIQIDTVSLVEFMNSYFPELFAGKNLGYDDKDIIHELSQFDINSIEDLSALLTHELHSYITNYFHNHENIFDTNFAFLLRSMMIMTDANKYFKQAWKEEAWQCETRSTLKFWSGYGVSENIVCNYIQIID